MTDTLLCGACGLEGSNADTCAACGATPLVEDRFILRSVLGRGAAGTTYRAEDRETGQVVALKEMPLGHPDDKRLEQLNREEKWEYDDLMTTKINRERHEYMKTSLAYQTIFNDLTNQLKRKTCTRSTIGIACQRSGGMNMNVFW